MGGTTAAKVDDAFVDWPDDSSPLFLEEEDFLFEGEVLFRFLGESPRAIRR